jgi:hypothetical protein
MLDRSDWISDSVMVALSVVGVTVNRPPNEPRAIVWLVPVRTGWRGGGGGHYRPGQQRCAHNHCQSQGGARPA